MNSKNLSPARERSTSRERKSQEFGSPHRSHRRSFAIPRGYRNTLIALLLLYLIHTFTHLGRHVYGAKLRDQPTDYTALAGTAEPIWAPEHPVRYGNETHIDDRYVFMRHLGQGGEGKTAIYVDTTTDELVVVKTYNYGKRGNAIPERLRPLFSAYTTQWRNEIEASIRFGQWREQQFSRFFVPVKDYFILQSSTDKTWTWSLVTPFIQGGTLVNLAKQSRGREQSPAELDRTYRPVLHSILKVLAPMHVDGYCHDDVKLDNIFVSVSDPKHWLLGDLGQVRHEGHAMHKSWGWKDRNQWADCRINDVRRLLKTYIAFLRDASGNPEGFDRAFVEREEVWSQFYWEWMARPVDAETTVELSRTFVSGQDDGSALRIVDSEKTACLTRKVDQELKCTRLETEWRDYLFALQC